MKCPRCGRDMQIDEHRKLPMYMCYECGYIQGRTSDQTFNQEKHTNFKHMKGLNLNEMIAFLSKGMDIDEKQLYEFFEAEYKE